MYDCTYTLAVWFEWDPVKAAFNLRHHGVDFADAATLLLVVVYTWRGRKIRIIPARRATRAERRSYEG